MELESWRCCWSHGLPHDLFGDILSRLELDDRIRFAAVCTNWRAVADDYPLAMPKSPWLMLPGGGYGDGMEEYRNLYRLSDQKVLRLHLPHIRDWRFLGSCDGWLVAIDDKADLHIINPLTRVVNHLPPTSTFCFLLRSERDTDNGQITGYYMEDAGLAEYGPFFFDMKYMREQYIFKAMFFPSASITIAIHGIYRELAYARPGDESWNQVELNMPFCSDFDDLILHKGVLYAVAHTAYTIGLDLSDCPLSPPKIAFQGPDNFSKIHFTEYHFLVESADDLLLLCRETSAESWDSWEPNEENYYDGPSYYGMDVYKTVLFKIYKLDPIKFQWIELTNLGDDVALFVGNNQSMSLSTKDLPELKGNSIYFTEDYKAYFPVPHVRRDMGVFSLEDGTIESFFPQDSLLHRLNWPPPLWITPSLS